MAERGTLKFEHNSGADTACMHTKFEGVQSHDHDFRRRKSVKSGQFRTSISR